VQIPKFGLFKAADWPIPIAMAALLTRVSFVYPAQALGVEADARKKLWRYLL
jgi:hypothetical protein